MKRLENKVALITGGSSGIGFETTRKMAEEGAVVYITGRREQALQKAVSQLGSNAHYVCADVAVKQDMLRVCEVIQSKEKKLDILFANAGIGRYIKLEELTEEEIDRTLDTNVKGTIFTVQAMLPILSEGASVILNTSITAELGLPDFSLYAASKAAVRSFIHSWTTDLKDRRIRVNAISPGIIPTAAATGELGRSPEEEQELQKWRKSLTPVGRMGSVEDIANAVIFLASDESSFVTGVELTVDGGMSAVFANRLSLEKKV